MGCEKKSELKTLIVTGGHSYDTVHFLRMFDSMDFLSYDTLIQPSANQLLKNERIKEYDVLVFYDMYQEISEGEKAEFVRMLEEGTGVVFLHHALASYQDWDEYLQIVGGRYSEDSSGYAHDLQIPVTIHEPNHPVTDGIDDFVIKDEIYYNYAILPDVKVILETNYENTNLAIGWCHVYGKSKIVYLQPGHDNNAFSHPSYRALVQNAIQWVSR